MKLSRRQRFAAAGGTLVLALAIFLSIFDWNWLRQPVERYVTGRTHRVFRIDDLHVTLGLNPVVRMRNVYFENAPWSSQQPMAAIDELEVSFSLRELYHGRVVVPELSLTGAKVNLERTADGRKNWLLSDPDDRGSSALRILALGIHGGTVSYTDDGDHFQVSASDVGRDAPGLLKSTDPKYQTRIQFKGTYREAPFSGEVLTSSLLSFQQTDQSFPLLGHLTAGQTRVDAEGTLSNLVELSAIDAQVKIQGATLANLYPFLLLPLPASPPYAIEGRLNFQGSTYRYGAFSGKIGSTDIAGDATYLPRSPRPLLRLKLSSRQMDLADLGPLVGVQTESGTGKPTVKAALASRQEAANSERTQNTVNHDPVNGDRILPSGPIDPERLRVLDAEVSFAAEKLKAPIALPFDSLHFKLTLEDALLRIDPVQFGFAGGQVTGRIQLNGKSEPLRIETDIVGRGMDLAKLLPASETLAPSEGKFGVHIQLSGEGDSIARALGTSSGFARGALSGGQISNLADAAVALNGGKVLGLLVTGDKPIALRCGAVDFEFNRGIGQARTLIVDTEQTQIMGTGDIDMGAERFNLEISPKPKSAGILSLRAPIRVFGTFRHPDYGIDKTIVAAHVGGAIALGILNPLAALLPLLETGPGEDANCHALLGSELTRATAASTATTMAREHPGAP